MIQNDSLVLDPESTRPFISDKEIRELYGISPSTLWRWTQNNGFPASIEGMRGRRSYKEVVAWSQKNNLI